MKSVLSPNPTFSPSTKTLSFSGIAGFTNNRLMVVVNQTRNSIIYAESVDGLGGVWDPNGKTLTLAFDTNAAGHASNDLLQVIYDAPFLKVEPEEELIDPVGKSRVSTPQSLIDTDFEYGLQSTKWEFVQLVNNRPTLFYDPAYPLAFNNISLAGANFLSGLSGRLSFAGGPTRTVVVSGAALTLPNGPISLIGGSALYPTNTPIYVQDALDPNANGFYLAEASTPAISAFSYFAKGNVVTGNVTDYNKTLIFPCNFYTGAAIPITTSTTRPALSSNGGTVASPFPATTNTVSCSTLSAHGLSVGDQIYLLGVFSDSAPAPSGCWTVASTPYQNVFTFDVLNPVRNPIITSLGERATLFARPAGYSIHRAFDGGVQFTCGPYTPGAQKIRQTRRYFRYQSGKGIQFSTGTILKPNFNLDSLTFSSGVVTLSTKNTHGMTPNCQIYVNGAAQSEYNGIYSVATVPNDNSLTYTIAGTPSTPANGFPISVGAYSWYGSTIRVGIFDNQNGMFFEHDGQTLYAVRRSSTQQLMGTVVPVSGASGLDGINTRFADQLNVGDFIVIKGVSYRVLDITSQTRITISPEYRGPSAYGPRPEYGNSGIVVSKTIDTRIPQSSWKIDKLDGTGPSGYTLDLTKMQMFYLDYSWYGAGFVRWGIRTTNGDIIYCHKQVNNNVNTEAYLRSGNLPARYEVNSLQPLTPITSTIASGDNTINVISTVSFPSQGTLRILGRGDAGVIEYVTYTGKTSTSFTGVTRAQTGGLRESGGSTFTYSVTSPINVELVNMTTTSTNSSPAAVLSHWGSSVIMDGRFDDDASFVFNAGSPTAASVAANTTNAVLSLRLAPSVDSGKTGNLGIKEVVNRMQLKLRSMDVSSATTSVIYRITLNLNGRTNFEPVWQPIGGSSLAQIAYYSSTAAIVSGGENVFSFFFPTGTAGAANSLQQSLEQVRDLGNSILGGGVKNLVSNTTNDIYPDGPDVLHVIATAGAGSGTINSRISWTEAQA